MCGQPWQVDAQMPGDLTQRDIQRHPHGPRLGAQPDNGVLPADFDAADLLTTGEPGGTQHEQVGESVHAFTTTGARRPCRGARIHTCS
ncbi:hypothetical protein [Nocardia tengchongensis]|uniref:hypothetical protein n=1 Tax=Nocardia tengchongensis TaxID=2055889 RepID=UPI0036BD1C1A